MLDNRVIGGGFIVAGTCIGAGMLALPIATAPTGFFISILLLIAAWYFMYKTGLLVMAVNLSLSPGNNYVSMAEKTLGKRAAFFTWCGFILLLYSLLAAYVTSGGELLTQLFASTTTHTIPYWFGPVLWTLLFASLLHVGIYLVDYLNRLFMMGLVSAYVCVLYFGIPYVHLDYYTPGQPQSIFTAFPIIFTSFGYQIVVPSMSEYLGYSRQKVRQVILLGSLLPLLVYLCWEGLIFGSIPLHGEQSLTAIYQSGQTTKTLIQVLQGRYGSDWIASLLKGFIFFALSSSFLGVSLGLFDFISDSLTRNGLAPKRWQVTALTFLPPFVYAAFFPHGFLFALNYAGIMVAILHGILPVLMVWSSQRSGTLPPSYHRFSLGIILLFFLCLILFDIGTMLAWLP